MTRNLQSAPPPTGRRTGEKPKASDTFLVKVLKALDEPPRMVAFKLGVPYGELKPLLQPHYLVAGYEDDEIWWKLSEYVDEKLAALLAIKHEMNVKLQKERSRRAVRIAEHRARSRKERPRADTEPPAEDF